MMWIRYCLLVLLTGPVTLWKPSSSETLPILVTKNLTWVWLAYTETTLYKLVVSLLYYPLSPEPSGSLEVCRE